MITVWRYRQWRSGWRSSSRSDWSASGKRTCAHLWMRQQGKRVRHAVLGCEVTRDTRTHVSGLCGLEPHEKNRVRKCQMRWFVRVGWVRCSHLPSPTRESLLPVSDILDMSKKKKKQSLTPLRCQWPWRRLPDDCHPEEEELGVCSVSYHFQPVFGSTRS